jgi:hypothetical protein
MLIKLRGHFRAHTLDNATINVSEGYHRYNVFIVDDVEVKVYSLDTVFELTIETDITEELYQHLEGIGYLSDNNELCTLLTKLKSIAGKLVQYIKYFWGIPELEDNNDQPRLQAAYTWRDKDEIWRITQDRQETNWKPTQPYYQLDENFIRWMPSLLNNDIDPLFGFTHLHKAFLETNTRHQWIDATIAAELAFKEFLGKFAKEVTPLLTHLPSPPLDKMYGSVLEAYTGQRSPVVKCFNNGSRVRNELIHRPRQVMPTKEETDEYLNQVQVALFHLHSLLNPESELFKFLLKRAEDKLSIVQERIKLDKITR